MFKLIEGLPNNVMGVEAIGTITHQDYQNTLIPTAEAMMAKGPIGMLYVIGSEFTGYELGAAWDDTVFGIKHWRDFSHIAVVTDHAWMGAMVSMVKPFFHGEIRMFDLIELPAAKVWITNMKKIAA